jgi:hypothetical protein
VKSFQNALGRLVYLLLTVVMTMLGVSAWLFSALRDRTGGKPVQAKHRVKPGPRPATPPRERVPK